MSSKSKTNWAVRRPIFACSIHDTDADELLGGEGGANAIPHLGEGNASDEAVSGVADAEWTCAAILLGDENGSCAEPDLRAQLRGEHQPGCRMWREAGWPGRCM